VREFPRGTYGPYAAIGGEVPGIDLPAGLREVWILLPGTRGAWEWGPFRAYGFFTGKTLTAEARVIGYSELHEVRLSEGATIRLSYLPSIHGKPKWPTLSGLSDGGELRWGSELIYVGPSSQTLGEDCEPAEGTVSRIAANGEPSSKRVVLARRLTNRGYCTLNFAAQFEEYIAHAAELDDRSILLMTGHFAIRVRGEDGGAPGVHSRVRVVDAREVAKVKRKAAADYAANDPKEPPYELPGLMDQALVAKFFYGR
jgi:hypothetical protein